MGGSTQAIVPAGGRPVLVWVISVLSLLSVASALLFYLSILDGSAFEPGDPLSDSYRSLTSFDWLLAFSYTLLVSVAAVALFRLHRVAVELYAIALVLNVSKAAREPAEETPRMVLGWIILGATVLYARHLVKKGILRGRARQDLEPEDGEAIPQDEGQGS